jgi:hypothetical protein
VERRGRRELKYNGNKEQASNGQGLSGMEEGCKQCPQRTVAIEYKVKKKEKEEEEENVTGG